MMFEPSEVYAYRRDALRERIAAAVWQDERALGWSPAERAEQWRKHFERKMRYQFGEVNDERNHKNNRWPIQG